MKSLKFCLTLIVVFGFSLIYGQAGDPSPGISISRFESGKKLSQDDVNFLALITTKGAANSRGANIKTTVSVGSKQFKSGDVINEADGKIIEELIKRYAEDNPTQVTSKVEDAPGSTRGCFKCYYWYCDYYGNCWWWWYCC